ncbi:sporulation integral membrane protein YtvI [Clostridium aminobutyricum]|uniref:Sporulation integral membrane protein YtvI n=1 Tax=Clostridium aminobutyricum TaxID=33953 RepID=A0A939D7W7_CLOAM|nr:sporulation integral membrane protein YtvI [Clostridium aminobutyricum]MBN7772368.1 sporulation integral membrane protein YtvI [Clostridium aminobutyricum]
MQGQQYEKKKFFIVNVLYGVIILLLVYVTLKHALKLVSPFIFAFIIAYFLRRPTRFLSSRLKIPYKPVAFLLVLVFYSTIGLLVSLIGIKIFSTVTEFILQVPYLYNTQIEPFLTSTFNNIEKSTYKMNPALVAALSNFFEQFIQSLSGIVSSLSVKAVTSVSNFASILPGLFIKLVIMIISTFFIAGDYDKLTGFVLRQFSRKGRKLVIRIKQYMIGTLFVCFRSYALIMSITFIELSFGLTLVGVDNAIKIALLISIFDIIPVLGTGGIMIPWTIITFLQGNYGFGFGLLVVYLTITIIRNIIEPKIVGSRIGLHPVVTLICIFVGAKLFGVIGIFGFPITLSLLRHLNDTGTIKIFK